ncbi:MAG TPA: hypothetical protein VGJ84_13985, partial [Polyangiaceae bacterium]
MADSVAQDRTPRASMGNLVANACVIAFAVGNTRLSRIRNGSTRAGSPAIRAARSSAQHVST